MTVDLVQSGSEILTPDVGILTQRSITLLQKNAPAGGYMGAFSGGKDSCVIKELAVMANVQVEWHYHVTTIDPPELVRFIRKHHPDVIFDRPKQGNMLRYAVKRGFPTRAARWCCQVYKESSRRETRPCILGVRANESVGRMKRWTSCVMYQDRTQQPLVLPIRLWSDHHIWQFIRWRKLAYCSLYDEGFTRLGCIGCPLQGARTRKIQFRRWPKIEAAWRRMFVDLWARRAGTKQRNGREWFGSALFFTPDELFDWWNDGGRNIAKWRLSKCH